MKLYSTAVLIHVCTFAVYDVGWIIVHAQTDDLILLVDRKQNVQCTLSSAVYLKLDEK